MTKDEQDEKVARKTRRHLRVHSAAIAAVDHVRKVATQHGGHRVLVSTLIYWFDQIAEDYEADIANLQSALDAKRAENRILRARYGLPPSGEHRVQSDEDETE